MQFSSYLYLFPFLEQEDGSAQADEGKNKDMLDKKAYFFFSCSLISSQRFAHSQAVCQSSCSISLISSAVNDFICLMLKAFKLK